MKTEKELAGRIYMLTSVHTICHPSKNETAMRVVSSARTVCRQRHSDDDERAPPIYTNGFSIGALQHTMAQWVRVSNIDIPPSEPLLVTSASLGPARRPAREENALKFSQTKESTTQYILQL